MVEKVKVKVMVEKVKVMVERVKVMMIVDRLKAMVMVEKVKVMVVEGYLSARMAVDEGQRVGCFLLLVELLASCSEGSSLTELSIP